MVNPAFAGPHTAVGCSLICRLGSIGPNLQLIINCVIKVCVGLRGGVEESNLQSALLHFSFRSCVFIVNSRFRRRYLTTGIKLFTSHVDGRMQHLQEAKKGRRGCCFIK